MSHFIIFTGEFLREKKKGGRLKEASSMIIYAPPASAFPTKNPGPCRFVSQSQKKGRKRKAYLAPSWQKIKTEKRVGLKAVNKTFEKAASNGATMSLINL